MQHEKHNLWGSVTPPYQISDDPKHLQPTVRAYLCENARAGVVIFPGGGYFQLSDEHEGTRVAEAFNKVGMSAFVVNYRYEPYDGRAILADGLRAVRYVRHHADEYRLDKDKIAVCGFSAGGHLAMLTAQQDEPDPICDEISKESSRPNACVLVYAVTTFLEGTFEAMPRIFLRSKKDDRELRERFSYSYKPDEMPPSFICASRLDAAVDCELNAKPLYDAMTAHERDVELKIYSDAPHGCGLGTSFADFGKWFSDATEFLRSRGF